MEEKKINIDMNLFKISGKTRKKRDNNKNNENKIKIKNSFEKKKMDTLKKKSILKMIRQHQEQRYKKLFEQDKKPIKEEENNDFNEDFKEAKDYLESLTEKNKNSFNKTLKNYSTNSLLLHPSINPFDENNTNISDSIISNTSTPSSPIILKPSLNNIPPYPKYGCLKNGNLPTYRTLMNQTRKAVPNIINNPMINISNPNITGGGREGTSNLLNKQNQDFIQKPILEQKQEYQQNIENRVNNSLKRANEIKQTIDKINEIKHNIKPKKMKRKKTIRRTFKIGKSKTVPKIGVLVSNKTIRNNISTKSQLLKQVPIDEVKKFLIKRGLIKVGSITPNDVLRKMYESSLMVCGEIYNHNPENLLYNFFNDK
jgi:hypothetical protein